MFLPVVFFSSQSLFLSYRYDGAFVKQCPWTSITTLSLFLSPSSSLIHSPFAVSFVSERSVSALVLLKYFQFVSGFLRPGVASATLPSAFVGGASQVSTVTQIVLTVRLLYGRSIMIFSHFFFRFNQHENMNNVLYSMKLSTAIIDHVINTWIYFIDVLIDVNF